MNLKTRMAGIDTNLDDLQSGIEACARAADTLRADTTKINGFLDAPLVRAVVRHVKELQACTRDQRVAMGVLREGISRLQGDLKRSAAAVKPPPLAVADPQRL